MRSEDGSGGSASGGFSRRQPPSEACLRLLKGLETKFGELIDDLDMLGMPLAAARAEHALDTFRQEAERLGSR